MVGPSAVFLRSPRVAVSVRISRRSYVILFLVLLAGGAPQVVSAQTTATVRGRVTDARTAGPLRGMLVEIVGSRGATVTNREGLYSLTGLPAGSYTLRFQWLGSRDQEVELELAEGEVRVLDIALEAEPIRLGEITVTTASRQPERVVESPAAISTVEPTRVRELAVTGQAPLLVADLPGVHVMQSGVNSFNVNVGAFNGLVSRRLLVLVDGRDVSAPIVGSQEWPALSVGDPGTRVELVRGPGSALYGANAFSGVLNFITPSIRQAQGTRMTVVAGELSTARVDVRHGAVSRDFRWGYSVKGNFSRTDSWDRSRTDTGDLAEEYEGLLDPNEIVPPLPGYEFVPLAGQSKAEPFGTPGPATGDPSPLLTVGGSGRVERYLENGGVVTAEGGYTYLENQVSAIGATRSQVGTSELPWGRVSWASGDFNVMAYYTARNADQTNLSTGQIFEDWSSRLHFEAQTTGSFLDQRGRFTVGGSLRREVVDSKGTILAPEHDGRSDGFYALFGHGSLELVDGLKGIVAARLDDSSLFDPRLSPKVGLLWMPTEDQSLRMTFGTAYLMPSATDRFVRFPLGPPVDLSLLEAGLRASPLGPALAGVPLGTLFTQSSAVPALAIGQEDRGPQEVQALEVGYKGQLERLFVSVDLHRSNYSDFATDLLPGIHPDFGPWVSPEAVLEVARGAVEDVVAQAVPGITNLEDGSTGIVYSVGTAGRATEWGLDLSAGLVLNDVLRLDANYSYVTVDFEEGSFLGGDSIPTNTPTHSGNASVTYTGSNGLRVRTGLTVVDAFHFQSGLFVGWVPGRQTVDVNASYPVSDRFSVSASATNLLNQRSYHYFGGSLVGRRVLVALSWEP
jgi:outer membrane receptor protein involved in Fe transport